MLNHQPSRHKGFRELTLCLSGRSLTPERSSIKGTWVSWVSLISLPNDDLKYTCYPSALLSSFSSGGSYHPASSSSLLLLPEFPCMAALCLFNYHILSLQGCGTLVPLAMLSIGPSSTLHYHLPTQWCLRQNIHHQRQS